MHKQKSLTIMALLACLAFTGSRGQEEYRNAIPAADTKPGTDIAALNNFADMRLGMMIHWGPCVMTGGEISWSMENRETYESAVNRFAPAKFNADDWLSVARECGAKYFTIVAKHHDGFCLWDTKTTDFNVMRSPMKRDVIGEVAASCRKSGLALGIYLSIIDIHESKWDRCYPERATMPGCPEQVPHIADFTRRQTLEVMDRWKPEILWYDGQWLQGWDAKAAGSVYDAIKAKDPKVVVRLERSTENDADYHCMESIIGTYRAAPWEVVTSVAYPSYSYHKGNQFKPAGVWIEKLSRIVCGNGNMLLNFIPDQDGVIGENQREIARGIGAWMAKNGEAVYQTRGGPWVNGTWGGATRKDRHIYIHITKEAPELLVLPDCGGKLVSSSSLSAENTKAEQDETGAIRITSPKDGRTASVSVVRLTMDRVVQGMVKQAVGASYPPSRKDDEPPPAEKK
jgi:alpha-L-fucosidase